MDSYYVYQHSYKGQIFYIGMGRGIRAFDFNDISRGQRWHEYVKSHPKFTARILKVFPTKIEALAYEVKKIKKLRPAANTHGVLRKLKIKLPQAKLMDASEMGKRGAKITNKLLTPEKRAKAAKKGWRLRKARLKK